ncbi:efflux RND transporter periplasmic adaptor subunit [Desulfurivibrio sp. C05AmB]|uniref:efflux RND transporter periplasmic adaptor subunit n=1 Tax=Desulfurivibrio sp. C05AmB TaxID=3374371 RepID=UPI00376EEEB4
MRVKYLAGIILAFALGAGLTAALSGRVQVPGHNGHEAAVGTEAAREVLYYRHPHNPRVTSEEPRKDEMGMDYIPIYADNGDGAGVRIAPETAQSLGVRTAVASLGTIEPAVEAVGFIDYDETRLIHVHVRTEGWVERLAARSLGQEIRQGELLFELYSPTLVNAQEEFLRTLAMNQPAIREASRRRLAALGLNPQTIEQLERDGRVRQLVPVFARQDGVLSELAIREGMFVSPGMDIMTIANLGRVWARVEVFEHQAPLVRVGQRALLHLDQAGGETLEGVVDFVYPSLDPRSRALQARLSFANPGRQLKPDMFTRVRIFGEPRREVLLIPNEALIRSGNSQRVILARPEGRFEAVEVRAGTISDDRVEILAGLNPGDEVVVSAQFLIDSESSLRASLTRLEPLAEPEPGQEVWSEGIYNGPGRSPTAINLSHQPIPELGWPAMTMDLELAPGLAVPARLEPGMPFHFALEQLDPVTFRIVALRVNGAEVRP